MSTWAGILENSVNHQSSQLNSLKIDSGTSLMLYSSYLKLPVKYFGSCVKSVQTTIFSATKERKNSRHSPHSENSR
jgi:hypothetical protein